MFSLSKQKMNILSSFLNGMAFGICILLGLVGNYIFATIVGTLALFLTYIIYKDLS